MTEVSTIPPPDMAAETPTEADAEARLPLRELLPQGRAAVVVAIVGAALTVTSLVDFGLSGRALVGAVLCPVLILLGAIDIRHQLLPNEIVLSSALLIALIVAATNPAGFFEHLEAGLALFGFLFVFAAIFKGGLGMGDAKLGLLLGLALGSRTFSAMMVAFVGLFLAALWIIATQGIAARKKAIPFGPFIALGGILAFFLG
jgi:prepilin signal peptidase PulO-like enzyme (type II secretory pathway)